MIPDFFAALYAAIAALEDGQLDEVDVTTEETCGDRTVSITVSGRRHTPVGADDT